MTKIRKPNPNAAALLSAEDMEAVQRWRTEVGEARFAAIIAALAPVGQVGRPAALEDRTPLLRAMAVEMKRHGMTVNKAATTVMKTAAAKTASKQSSATSLHKWLTRTWPKHSQQLLREERTKVPADYRSMLNIIAGTIEPGQMSLAMQAMKLAAFNRADASNLRSQIGLVTNPALMDALSPGYAAVLRLAHGHTGLSGKNWTK